MMALTEHRIAEMAARRAIEMMAVMKPRPSSVNKTQASEMLNISLPTLRRLLATGAIRLNKAGMISTVDIDTFLAEKAA